MFCRKPDLLANNILGCCWVAFISIDLHPVLCLPHIFFDAFYYVFHLQSKLLSHWGPVWTNGFNSHSWKIHTVTSKPVAMPNPNTAREVRCNHPWELHLALVGTNTVQTIGYKCVPGSCDAVHSSWRYSHFEMTTPLQQFCTLGIDQAFSTGYSLLLPWLLLMSFQACSQSTSETPQLVSPSISLESPPITHKS